MTSQLTWLSRLIEQEDGALKFLGGTNLSFSGSETILVDGPNLNVLHEFSSDSFGSARYIIHAECGSDQRETLEAVVVTKLDQAALTVFGRVNTGVNLVNISADISNSILKLYATPAVTGLQNIKCIVFATLAEKIVESDSRATVYNFTKVESGQFIINAGPYTTDQIKPQLTFYEGLTYRFDQTDPSNNDNPMLIGTSLDLPASFYSVGVRYYLNGIIRPRTDYINTNLFNSAAQRYIEITVTENTPTTLYYFSSQNNNVGNAISVSALVQSGGGGGSGSGGGGGGGPVAGANTNLSNLESTAINLSLIPNVTSSIDLGSNDKRWRDLYLSGTSLIIGDATITATGSSINLPSGTTVGGQSISGGGGGGGASNSFETIAVAGQSNLVADSATDTLTVVAGSGISITTNSGTDTLTINNTSPNVTQNVFGTISVSGQSNVVAEQANDTLTLVAGPNVTITTNPTNDSITISAVSGGSGGGGVSSGQANRLTYYASTGTIVQDTGANLTWDGTNLNIIGSITASAPVSYIRAYFDTLAELQLVSPITWHGMVAHVHETGRMYFAHAGTWTPLANQSDLISNFSTIAISGQSSVVADQLSDTLTLVAGSGILITSNAGSDSITISATVSGGASNSFETIAVAGQSSVIADSSTDTLTLVAGSGISITTNNSTDSITITNTASAGNSFGTVAVAGQSNVAADQSNDTLTLVAGLNISISTDASTDTVTINAVSGGASANSFSTIAVSGQSNIEAEQLSDTLTFVAGTGITITTDAGTDSLTISASTGPTTFNGLTDATSASVTIDKIAYPAITLLQVTNNSSVSYLFNNHYSGNNPTVYAISGTTIAFNLNVAGHPFLIQTSGGSNYDTGLIHVATNGTVSTGSSAQGQTAGTLYWQIPIGTTGNYRYQCSIHGGMVGVLSIKDLTAI